MRKANRVILFIILGLVITICITYIVDYMRWYGNDKQEISQTIPSETYIPPEGLFDKIILREWEFYSRADSLISEAEYIYEGEVTDITYEVSNDLNDKEVVTVYTISVNENYKGETPDETYVVRGGVVQEDIDKWEHLATETEGAAVDIGSYITLEKGKEYVFLIGLRDESGYDKIVNPTQFAFKKYMEVEQPINQNSIPQTEEYNVLMRRLGIYKNVLLTGGYSG